MKTIKKIIAAVLAVLIIAGAAPVTENFCLLPDMGVLPLDGLVMVARADTQYEIDASTQVLTDGNTYITSSANNDYRITVNGTVTLILKDGTTFNAKKGFTITDGGVLNIRGETEGTGKLVVKADSNTTAIGNQAVIDATAIAGNVNIYGGVVEATGGEGADGTRPAESVTEAAGKKGGHGIGGDGATVGIYGGMVTAQGGNGGKSFYFEKDNIDFSSPGGTGGSGICGNVTIQNGNVTAKGGNGGQVASGKNGGNGGDAIHGDCTGYGILTATPGSGGKAIGGSNGQSGVAISGTDTMIRHVHSFTYSADGATITATCTDDCWLDDHKATLTINGTGTFEYYPGAKYKATINGDTAVLGKPAITYKKQDANGEFTISTGSGGYISDIGTFRASITVGGVTASVEFTIVGRATKPTITQQPTDLSLQNGATTGNILTVVANEIEGHTLSYQWYSNTTNSTTGSTMIDGATSASYAVPTNSDGTTYYYCVVTATRTDNNDTATANSAIAAVTVTSHTHSFNYTAEGATITATCENTDANCPLTENPTLTIAAPTGDLTYDGTEKAATITGDTETLGTPTITYKKGTETLDGAPVNAGTYTASITVEGVTASVEYTVAPVGTVATPTFSPAAGTYYETKSVTISCETDGASIYYTTNGEEPTASSTPYTAAIDIDTTTTIKAIAVKTGWTDSEVASATYTITEKPAATITTVPTAKTLTYNGDAQELVNDGAADTDIEYSTDGTTFSGTIPTGKNSDTYTVYYRAAADANHSAGDKSSFTVTIAPKNVTVTGATATDREYNQESSVNITAIALDGICGTDNVSVNVTGLTGTISGADTGTYYSVTLPALTLTGTDSGNYTLTQPTAAVPTTVLITKTTYTGTVTASGSACQGTSGTVDLTALIENGGSLGSVSVTSGNDILNGVPSVSGQSVAFAFADNAAVGSTAEVKVPVINSKNYNDYIITVTLTVSDKTTQTLSFANAIANKTYGDAVFVNPLSGAQTAVTYSSDNPTVADVDAAGNVTIKAAGTANITASAAASDSYSAGSASYALNVAKAPVTVKGDDKTVIHGEPDPALTATVSGMKNGDPETLITYTISRDLGTDIGRYTITPAGDAEQGNYSVTYQTGTFTIAEKTFTVTFDSAGGTPVSAQNVAENATAVRPADPVRSGFTFKYWTLDGVSEYNFASPITGDMILTAVWEETIIPVTYFTVTFDSAGGTSVAAQNVAENSSAVRPADPVRNGFTFSYWTLDGVSEYNFASPVTGDMILTAVWTQTPAPEPQPQPKPDVPVSPDNTYRESDTWEKIENAIDKTPDGTAVTVIMNMDTTVPKDIFDKIRSRNIDIIFNMGNGITWTVNGTSVTNVTGNIDLGITAGVNLIPVDVINNITGERYNIQISIAHDGDFGFTAILTVNLESKNAGLYANLFHYNEMTGSLDYETCSVIGADGNAKLSFWHASEFAIVIDDHPYNGIAQASTNNTPINYAPVNYEPYYPAPMYINPVVTVNQPPAQQPPVNATADNIPETVINDEIITAEEETNSVLMDGDSARLIWKSVDNAKIYSVYRKNSAGEFVKIGTVKKNSVRMTKLKNGKKYEVIIKANLTDGTEKNVPGGEFVFTPYFKPIVKATVIPDGRIHLEWNKVSGAKKYKVYRIENGKKKPLGEIKGHKTTITVKKHAEYKYAVSAYIDGEWTEITEGDVVTVTVD